MYKYILTLLILLLQIKDKNQKQKEKKMEKIEREIPFIEGESIFDYEQRLFAYTKEKYGKGIARAREFLSDELYLAFYKKGDIDSGSASLQELKDNLFAAKLMQKNVAWGNTEKAYSVGIDNIIADLEKAIKEFKCDVYALKKDSIFYFIAEKGGLKKYRVLKKKTYKTHFDTRVTFEVKELDTKSIIVGENQFWVFLYEELVKFAWDNEEEATAFYDEMLKNDSINCF